MDRGKDKDKENEVKKDEKREPIYSEFPLICPNCGRVFYQDYNNTEENGVIICPYCGNRFR